MSAYRPAVSEEQETDFMASILGGMDSIPSAPPPKARKRSKPEPPEPRGKGKAPARSNGYEYRGYDGYDDSSDGPVDVGFGNDISDDEDVLSPKKKLKVDNNDNVNVKPTIEKLSQIHVESSGDEGMADEDVESAFEGVDMDAFMEVDDFDDPPKPKLGVVKKEEATSKLRLPKLANKEKEKEKKAEIDAAPAWLSVYESLQVKAEDPDALGAKTQGLSSKGVSGSKGDSSTSVLEEDGSLRFFWTDYLEHDGRIYFIGKTLSKPTLTWQSICVTVENLQRNLFVLPRSRRMEEDEETGELVETDVVPSLPDVYGDFDRVRKRLGVKSFKGKFVRRRYAFGEEEVPREAQWLKVVYPFDGQYILNSPSFIFWITGFNVC